VNEHERLPFCSIVVPTRGRPEQLRECLDALAALDYPADLYEVVVVDDGGDSPLEAAVGPFRDRIPLSLLRREHGGPAAARNAGAARARGSLLAFTDDDCRPSPQWLRRLAEHHVLEPDVALGGHTVNALHRNPFSAASQLIINAGYGWNNYDPRNARFFTTNNLAVPASAFRELGGLDVRFRTSEDRDFCDRWVASGRRMHYVADALVHHAHALTLRGFCRQHFSYGRGAFRFHSEHLRREHRRVPLEPRFYLGVHATAWRGRPIAEALELQAILALWHVINAAGFVWEGARSLRQRAAVRAASLGSR
jgi:GT2 family glycosyltransferase